MTRSSSILVAVGLFAVASCTEKPSPPPTVASATASSAAANVEPAEKKVSLKERSEQVVSWLAAGENAKVRALFDEAMGKAVPTDAAVGDLWKNVVATVGKLEKVIDTTEQKQGAYDVVLVTCAFEASPMDLKFVFDGEGHIAGFFMVPTQNPRAFGPRPQTPKAPFPYATREASYDNATDKTHLEGTLSLPKGAGPFPAVLLITGSGSQDRDETIFGHKPFLVIADHLTKNGIAVLRVDDPGIGGSRGDTKNATIESHARDAEAGLAFLAKQKEIDPKRLGLIGHSEGGIIAAVVAARSKEVAFAVSLAGTGVSGGEINPLQVEAILRAQGKFKDEQIKGVVDAQRKLMKLLAKDADDKTIEAAVKDAFDAASKLGTSAEDQATTQQALASSLKMIGTPWFKSFVKLDPAVHWSKVTAPVLAMVGEKDTQVPADVNLAAIKTALAKAKNKDASTEKLPGLNHLFQPAKTGLLEEYPKIETTFDAKTLELMTGWLKRHAGVKEP